MKIVSALVFSFFVLMTAAAAEENEVGKAVFISRCSTCHQLPEPGMLKPDQWRQLLDTKQKLMEKAGMPPLTDEEYKNLLDYLMQQAKR